MRHQIKPQKTYSNKPKRRGSTLWHVMLVWSSKTSRKIVVNETGKLLDGETQQHKQLIRSIAPQAAARRFIRKRLPVVAVLQDDGANTTEDALGGQRLGRYPVKIRDAKRYRLNRFSAMKREMGADVGGTYGIAVEYR